MRKALLATALLISTRAEAQVRQLTFEGLQNNEVISNYYNGGTGSNGSGPGPSWGITFSNSALALCPTNEPGCTGNFGNQPSGRNVMYWVGEDPVMNVANGFTTGFSTYYTSTTFDGFIEVWSGLDATGSLLGSLNLTALGESIGEPCSNPGQVYCRWDQVGLEFAGTAYSIRFGGTADQIAYDNVTFGASNANTVVPEPSSAVLVAAGLGGLFAAGRRKVTIRVP